jgi:hypothetical protein
MLAMVREHGGDGEIAVPPTIHALLQARIDSLDGDVRLVMERGAVEGEVFHRGTVAELSPELVRDGVEAHLATLVRKELIRATAPTFPSDEGFRFRHLLIRDAAYESLPKATRAELHEHFADWLSTHELVERDEIVGYHLEQAQRYRAELDGSDPALDELARRASAALAAAGLGALERGDFNAGRSLFARAAALLPEGDEARLALAPAFADALFESGDETAWEILERAAGAADPGTRAQAMVTMATWAVTGPYERSFDEREAWRDEARAVFESAGDDYGLSLYWTSVVWESWMAMRAADTAAACERALTHLERVGAGGRRLARPIRARLVGSYYQGPMPVAEGLERVGALETGELGVLEQASQQAVTGLLLAMTGEVDRGRELHGDAREVFLEAGLLQTAGGMALGQAEIAFRAGDPEMEEHVLRDGLELLGEIGDRSYYPTVAAVLAECLFRRGADDAEIEELCVRVRQTTGADDLANHFWLEIIGGMLHARRGQSEETRHAVQRALALVEKVDFHFPSTVSRALGAEALAQVGCLDEAQELATEALRIFAAKGDATGADRFRARFTSVGIDAA